MRQLLAFSLGVLCLLGLLTTSSVGAVEGGEPRLAATPGPSFTPTRTPTQPFAYSPTGDWKQASPNGNIRSVFCLDDQHCWIGAGDNADYGIRYGHLYDTRDGGRTWTSRQFTKTPSPVRFFDGLHGTAGP